MAQVAASLRALLAQSIDYAGLFPPASLDLETSLKNYARYLRANDSWMLSTFVLPLAKFGEAAWFASEFKEEKSLRVSALGAKTINETDFAEELKNVGNGIQQLATVNSVRIEQLEMPLPQKLNREIFHAARSVSLRSFWEAPAGDVEETIALLAAHNAEGDASPLGFKLRTGGVTADAFPGSDQIARALVASARHRVPIKFTAGLHHPLRMFRQEVKAKMHGFLNVFGAGVLAREHGWNEELTAAMLDDEDAGAFEFTDETFTWREAKISTVRIKEHRQLITSFGSCSFDEPREDLRTLKML
jgi:hypothetical protein